MNIIILVYAVGVEPARKPKPGDAQPSSKLLTATTVPTTEFIWFTLYWIIMARVSPAIMYLTSVKPMSYF